LSVLLRFSYSDYHLGIFSVYQRAAVPKLPPNYTSTKDTG